VHCGDEEAVRWIRPAADAARLVETRRRRQTRMPERVDAANGIVGVVVRRFIADQR
jgi:hypothetical protein